MKRTIAILLAALMLTGILTACSGTVGMDDGRAYGNVSTTPNGTVNGGSYGYDGNDGYPYAGGSYGSNGYQSGGNSYRNGSRGNTGTGMTGG